MSGKPSLAGSSTLPPSLQILLQKQQEHAALQALKEASEDLVARAERLAEMSTTMADGGETIGQVLETWSYIFKILESLGQAAPHAGDPVPTLVRLPYHGEDAPAAE